jgi:tRNA pseudouridine55 synthase
MLGSRTPLIYMDGFLLIDKPAGWTSHDVVGKLRRITGVSRIGHAGTLDPFATGLLIVGVGRSCTKRLGEFLGQPKSYEAVAVLGATTATQDKDGKIIVTADASLPTEAQIRAMLPRFTGELRQTPPMFSAKKIDGKKLYELAREGITVERKPVAVTVHSFELLSYDSPRLRFRVNVSSGTYVRTLAHDLGAALGCGAYLEELRRTLIGTCRVEDAVKIEDVTPENWESKLVAL